MKISTVPSSSVTTPFLLLHRTPFERNVAHLKSRINSLGATLRPHLKTAKSIEAAHVILDDKQSPITVSTLQEAEAFAYDGYTQILYAVGIVPQKLERVASLILEGVDLVVILDSVFQAEAVNDASIRFNISIPALIEIDCDGHRGGLAADDPSLLRIGNILDSGHSELRGVLTHAGESYYAISERDLIEAAENERSTTVSAAELLKKAGLPCPCVSVGSTPTAHFAQNLEGVTEVRAGVYVFFDLVMNGIGVCRLSDIALSLVCSVIGRSGDDKTLFVDAGWMALSQDKGIQGEHYGLVCDMNGAIYTDLIVKGLNQEHGILSIRKDSDQAMPDITIGTQLRILPNHACATAAQHTMYHVLSDDNPTEYEIWPRLHGW